MAIRIGTVNNTDSVLYEVLAIELAVVNDPARLATLELELNTDNREGYAIYPILDRYGDLVWEDRSQFLVLCLAKGV